jgi:hypothetical protein
MYVVLGSCRKCFAHDDDEMVRLPVNRRWKQELNSTQAELGGWSEHRIGPK